MMDYKQEKKLKKLMDEAGNCKSPETIMQNEYLCEKLLDPKLSPRQRKRIIANYNKRTSGGEFPNGYL